LDVESVEHVHVDQEYYQEELYSGKSSGILHFKNGDTFKGWFSSDFQQRIGVLTRWSHYGLKTSGQWHGGLMDGLMVMENEFGGYEEANFSSGRRHGPSRAFGPCPQRSDNLWQVSFYHHGKLRGQYWRGCLGGGYLTGVAANQSNDVSGDNVAFIFSNLSDAVCGKFLKGKLVTGGHYKLASVEIVDGIAIPQFCKTTDTSIATRDISTAVTISRTPLIGDGLEHSRVEVKQSGVGQTAGEGLFSKVLFRSGDLVSMLNGTRVIPSLDEEWSDYKVHFNTDFDIDIPDDMRRLDQYCSTLAHKANHSFSPNTTWGRMDHPKFGLIVTLIAKEQILPGEEVTVNYNYHQTVAPAWYKECLQTHKQLMKKKAIGC